MNTDMDKCYNNAGIESRSQPYMARKCMVSPDTLHSFPLNPVFHIFWPLIIIS
jgi:hypothetical protein